MANLKKAKSSRDLDDLGQRELQVVAGLLAPGVEGAALELAVADRRGQAVGQRDAGPYAPVDDEAQQRLLRGRQPVAIRPMTAQVRPARSFAARLGGDQPGGVLVRVGDGSARLCGIASTPPSPRAPTARPPGRRAAG